MTHGERTLGNAAARAQARCVEEILSDSNFVSGHAAPSRRKNPLRTHRAEFDGRIGNQRKSFIPKDLGERTGSSRLSIGFDLVADQPHVGTTGRSAAAQ